MKPRPLEIAGYTVLPVQLPATPLLSSQPATHYLYLRRHEPRIPDPDSLRSLFVVNLPVDTTETHLRHLFGTQLSAGRVERVEFEDVPTPTNKKHSAAVVASTTHGSVATTSSSSSSTSGGSKKRKRVTADELQNALDEIRLPTTWDRQLLASGARAVIVFVDKPSMEASLKAATNAGAAVLSKRKTSTMIVWGEGISKIPPLGLSRYLTHDTLRYPSRRDLLHTVNTYMALFEQVNEARKREETRKLTEPDEDGFVTVTHGAKVNSVAREDDLKALMERKKEKEKGLDDFYRFQSREKRKERQNELLRRFDQDKRKLEEMKKRRGKIRVSINSFVPWMILCDGDEWLLRTYRWVHYSRSKECHGNAMGMVHFVIPVQRCIQQGRLAGLPGVFLFAFSRRRILPAPNPC